MPKEKQQPDRSTIATHLRHITRRWGELGQPVTLEIVHLTADDKADVKDVSRYSADDIGISMAVDHIAAMNALRLNSYAVVNPVDGSKQLKVGRRASAEDIVAAFFHWADADSGEAADNIRNFVGPKCTFHVLTGTQPTMRPHVYWELEEPTRNLEAWRRIQSSIAATLKTDPAVIDAPRIMRVAGTINWPKPKKLAKGYVAELTHLKIYDSEDRTPVTSERMERAFSGAPKTAGPIIDTGEFAPALDRERARIQALSGEEWHNAVIRLVASYVAKGLADDEIHSLTQPLTLPGYAQEQTQREVQTAIEGARRKGWTPEQYADPEALVTKQPGRVTEQGLDTSHFDAPTRPANLEWFDEIEPVLADSYIVKGVLGAGAMSVVYGPSNSGKTFFALDMAFGIATGGFWNRRKVTKSAVLYLAAEGGRGIANRFAALRQETGCVDVPMALKRAGLDLLHDQADLQHIVDLAVLVQAKMPGAPLLIVIDTLSRIMAGGDENSAADMTALIRNIDAIRAATGAHIMLVHHTGKDTARGARGHSSLRAATDTEIEVGSNDDGGRLALVTKQRDYQGGESFGFTLKTVSLGFDQDGDEVFSCVIEAADAAEIMAARERTKGMGDKQKLIVDSFDQMLAEGMGTPNPSGVGFPDPGRFLCVKMEDLRRISQGKMAVSDPGKTFRQAWAALSDSRGVFCMADNLVWRTDRKRS